MCFQAAAAPPARPRTPYRQTHRPDGILPCPCCHREMCVVNSHPESLGAYKQHAQTDRRLYYVTCENDECEGVWNGPTRSSVRDAVRANNECLLSFAKALLPQGHIKG